MVSRKTQAFGSYLEKIIRLSFSFETRKILIDEYSQNDIAPTWKQISEKIHELQENNSWLKKMSDKKCWINRRIQIPTQRRKGVGLTPLQRQVYFFQFLYSGNIEFFQNL